jgi:Dolichyl-phosphate-mannose-protein mannosyltransferase
MHESEAVAAVDLVPIQAAQPQSAVPVATNTTELVEPARRNQPWLVALGSFVILVLALAALVPTVGDFGLTWDEPAYRYSQLMSAQWWEHLGKARSWNDLRDLFDPLTLIYYWPYGRYGVNFHPPLAGQANLAAYAVFGHWMKDIPARRMASVIEFALAVTIGFHFMARRYGGWVALVMAGSLLFLPRLYGQAHLIDTDTPGLLLWSAIALAFWNGLHDANARRWRVAVGILVGLAFIEKMAAVVVLLPLLLWLMATWLPRLFKRRGWRRGDWIDGIFTTGAMLAPLALAFQQIQILQQRLPPPTLFDPYVDRPTSDWTGLILAVPLSIWVMRRLVGRLLRKHPVWGVERPALETLTSILAFAPVIGWLGNPAWWREALPRLAHYYTLNNQRRGALPDIQIIYFGQVYEYSLPWHNAWVLIGITVPVAILGTALLGLIWAVGQIRRDKLPLYFLVHFLTLPIIRMFDMPAHDGVRLFLPAFFFLAAFAGWGAIWLAEFLARRVRVPLWLARVAITSVVLGSAATALYRVHPYELSYYNALVGGPRGAWSRGFDLSYWYDAFNGPVLADINARLPHEAQVDFLNENCVLVTFQELQSLGALRPDILLVTRQADRFPFVWLLTHDSKAIDFTRALFAMRPWYTSAPDQLGGSRVASVADPVAVSRAWALQVLLGGTDLSAPEPPAAPAWVNDRFAWLARFWGDGLWKAKKLTLNQAVLDWSRSDPQGLLETARHIASGRPPKENTNSQRLMDLITAESDPRRPRHFRAERLLVIRPEALVEAVQIINAHRDTVERILTRYGYTDPRTLDGYLDRDLPNPYIDGEGSKAGG